ncbi:MAG TPA: lipase maturation factor family protein, partial [Minicystis sp.]|nr:lipase maturation factor family protein [Minicystis sp.]
HLRLDWQMWFTQFGGPDTEPWIVELAAKLLRGDRGIKTLLAVDPFPDAPPKFVRAEVYRYAFTRIGDGSGAWWRRSRVGTYFPPLSLGDPRLAGFLEEQGLSPP